MRAVFWSGLFVTLFLSSGCLLSPGKIDVPQRFDLPGGSKVSVGAGMPSVRIGVIRNISGADRRFLIRTDGSRMLYDETRCWLNSPEAMLERVLRSRFSRNGSGADVTVDAVITRFEFDAEFTKVCFSAVYSIRRRRQVCDVNCVMEMPVNKGDVAGAMASALAGSLDKLNGELQNFIKNGDKSK